MFETSVVEARVAQRRYTLLSVSLAVHSLVVIAVIAAGIASTGFPKDPPRELQLFFQQAELPKPPAAPHPAATPPAQTHPAAAANNTPQAATAPLALTTPNQIPNTIPTVQVSSSDPGPQIGNSNTVGPGNVIGDPNSVDVGQPPSNSTPVPDTVFHPGVDVHPAVVLQRVEPQYPRAALVARMTGTVVVKCIVDKNGNVRDAEVVTSSFGAFEEPALDALRRWRFAPGSFRGKPVDTWFELTIRFVPR